MTQGRFFCLTKTLTGIEPVETVEAPESVSEEREEWSGNFTFNVVSNNVANINTTAFKSADTRFEIRILLDRLDKVELIMKAGAHREEVLIDPSDVKVKLKNARDRAMFLKDNLGYQMYHVKNTPSGGALKAQRAKRFDYSPKISLLVPVYNPDMTFLLQLIKSVQAQSYENWEMCLAIGSKDNISLVGFVRSYAGGEKRLKFKALEKNEGISGNTNQALLMATGDVVAFADQDDLLSPEAFYRIVATFNKYPEADMVYTDEDKVTTDGRVYYAPHFKTVYNPDLLRSTNYICHLTAMKMELVKKIGRLDPKMDGAQDYDYVLRASEKAAKIVHIPRVLYHWRVHPGSTAGDSAHKAYTAQAGYRALQAHLKRCKIKAEIDDSFRESGYYTLRYKKTKKASGGVTYILSGQKVPDGPKAQYMLFINENLEFVGDEWLSQLLGVLDRNDVAAVGGCIVDGQNRIQSMGMVYSGDTIYHMFKGMYANDAGYANRNRLTQDVSILSLDFMLIKTEVYEKVGGIRDGATRQMQSLDLCFRLRKAGYRLVTVPSVQAKVRDGAALAIEDRVHALSGETSDIRASWKPMLDRPDPYFSKALSVGSDGNWYVR